MPQRIQRNSRITPHRSTHPKWEQDKTEKSSYGLDWLQKAYDMVPQSWILHCFKMFKISHEFVNFIEQTIKTRRVELTAGGRSIAETKIQRGIFQGDALSPLLFIIAMMPLNHTLRKCAAGYKLSRSQEKINHLMYMNDIKLFTKNEKELENLIHTVRIYRSGHGNGIWHRKMYHTRHEKWQATYDWRNGTKLERSKKMKPTNTWGSWRLISSDKCKWKRRSEKNISGEWENYSWQNSPAETSSKE